MNPPHLDVADLGFLFTCLLIAILVAIVFEIM